MKHSTVDIVGTTILWILLLPCIGLLFIFPELIFIMLVGWAFCTLFKI